MEKTMYISRVVSRPEIRNCLHKEWITCRLAHSTDVNYNVTLLQTNEINTCIKCALVTPGFLIFFLVLTVFNEGAYLTCKSILHNALNLF